MPVQNLTVPPGENLTDHSGGDTDAFTSGRCSSSGWFPPPPHRLLFCRSESASTARCFVHRDCATRRSCSLRASALTLRHRSVPKPTACRWCGGGDSLRLAMSSISRTRSITTSGSKPVWRTILRSVMLRSMGHHQEKRSRQRHAVYLRIATAANEAMRPPLTRCRLSGRSATTLPATLL